MEYDYKEVDWKAVKAGWDASPMYFSFNIRHGERLLSFSPYLDKSKRYRLWLYVDGLYNGHYGFDGHEYLKYHNIKKLPVKKADRKWNESIAKHNKRVRKELRIDMKPIEPYPYATPVFDNVAQIKKMIAALE